MGVGEIYRKMGVAEATFYVWRKKYGGLGPSELKRLRVLEDESRKLKQLVPDLSLSQAPGRVVDLPAVLPVPICTGRERFNTRPPRS